MIRDAVPLSLQADTRPTTLVESPNCVVELALLFTRELLHHAFNALVNHDRRFHLAEHAIFSQEQEARLALIDGHEASAESIVNRLRDAHAVGGVVLMDTALVSQIEVGAFAPFVVDVASWDTPWSTVTRRLIDVWRQTHPGSPSSLDHSVSTSNQDRALHSLTQREREVLRLIARGYTVRQMALCLHLAESTIDNHKSRLMKKIGVKKSIDLARFAYRQGVALP